ncbi:hypothetical protein BpHYR1_026922 [Brachionus plicatilis]|uniref:Uncharacterized protein n=1 Tax=Brachionus plicatilis TaxID=10195 RepID=A0A3M7QYU6_BRAPC|nr:hypothetical protein BpHYR1_026922 [Brachionus plicatilis]
MVFVIKNIHQIGIERMHLVQFWKISQYLCQFIMVVLLCIFYLTGVKLSNPTDCILFVYDCWCFSLGLGQNYIYKVLGRWYSNLIEKIKLNPLHAIFHSYKFDINVINTHLEKTLNNFISLFMLLIFKAILYIL